MAKRFIHLDKDREFRFDFNALVALEEQCHINILQSQAYKLDSPTAIRDMAWAGQLVSDKPLSREQVGKFLSTDADDYVKLAKMIAEALREALGIKVADVTKS